MSLGKKLRGLRESRGWTQADLAAKLNLTDATINRYEKDLRNPDFETLRSISELFGVTFDFLLGTGPDPTAEGLKPITDNRELIQALESRYKMPSLQILRAVAEAHNTTIEDMFGDNILDSVRHFFQSPLQTQGSMKRYLETLNGTFIMQLLPDAKKRMEGLAEITEKAGSTDYVKKRLAPLVEAERNMVRVFLDHWADVADLLGEHIDGVYKALTELVTTHFPDLLPRLRQLGAGKAGDDPFSIPPSLQNAVPVDQPPMPAEAQSQYTPGPPPGLKLREQPRPGVLAQLDAGEQQTYYNILAMEKSPFGAHRKTGQLTDEMLVALVKFYHDVRENDRRLGRGPNKPTTEKEPEGEK